MTPNQPPDGQVSRLTLGFGDPRDDPDWPVVMILIDGRDLSASVAPGWGGFDPDEILGPRSPLLPVHPGRRTAVYRCSCGEAGCGVIAPLIAEPTPNLVTWSDFRDYTGVFIGPAPLGADPDGGHPWDLPSVRFSGRQYRGEVARASSDRSWETPRRATARLLKPLVEQLVARARLLDVERVSVAPAYRAEGVNIALRRRATPRADASWEHLRLDAPGLDPQQAAESIAARLRATPAAEWGTAFRPTPTT